MDYGLSLSSQHCAAAQTISPRKPQCHMQIFMEISANPCTKHARTFELTWTFALTTLWMQIPPRGTWTHRLSFSWHCPGRDGVDLVWSGLGGPPALELHPNSKCSIHQFALGLMVVSVPFLQMFDWTSNTGGACLCMHVSLSPVCRKTRERITGASICQACTIVQFCLVPPAVCVLWLFFIIMTAADESSGSVQNSWGRITRSDLCVDDVSGFLGLKAGGDPSCYNCWFLFCHPANQLFSW